MRFEHPEHPGAAVRLGYCLNLHPAPDLDGLLRGLREVTLPLAERVHERGTGERFGIGPWLPATLAEALVDPRGAESLDRLAAFLAANGLEAFTFNAFPAGDFHRPGLKQAVFAPAWDTDARRAFTVDVARLALALRPNGATGHLSISTHTGGYASELRSETARDACAANLARCAEALAFLEAETGTRIVLSLEPEPGSLAGDTAALPALFERIAAQAGSEENVRRHLGTCLDACHAAVAFEEPAAALARATAGGHPLGKLQFSSALALTDPDGDEQACAVLFGMDEPVYLHQVFGRRGERRCEAADLPDLKRAFEAGDPDWRGCDEWRCHFHVPVDLAAVGGLGTTRDQADRLLDAALANPSGWGTAELHVEIETYTWDVLPSAARGPGTLVDGLEREVLHVQDRLRRAGWLPARPPADSTAPR